MVTGVVLFSSPSFLPIKKNANKANATSIRMIQGKGDAFLRCTSRSAITKIYFVSIYYAVKSMPSGENGIKIADRG